MENNYTVKAGDNLTNIAKQYGTTIQNLASANNIANPNAIKVGQSLKIANTPINQPIVNAQTTPPATTPTPIKPSELQPVQAVNIPVQQNAKSVNVTSYKDNPDGTTTNFLSDGSTSTVKYTKNADGTMNAVEVTPMSQSD